MVFILGNLQGFIKMNSRSSGKKKWSIKRAEPAATLQVYPPHLSLVKNFKSGREIGLAKAVLALQKEIPDVFGGGEGC